MTIEEEDTMEDTDTITNIIKFQPCDWCGRGQKGPPPFTIRHVCSECAAQIERYCDPKRDAQARLAFEMWWRGP